VSTAEWQRLRPSPEARGYGREHQALRRQLQPLVLAGNVQCARCGELIVPGQPWDLGHADGDRSKYSGPEHQWCNRATTGRQPWWAPPVEELERERDGLAQDDPCWRVPWLRGLRRVPADAVWPRLMTVPHPAATGSLGREFVGWAEGRQQRKLRWWQQLVATRLLETDADGRLVWETLVLSLARQLGKSWLLRELLLWRIHQGARFGEPQDVMHTGKDVPVTKEVQRPALSWAKGRPGYRVREANGEQMLELLEDGSRWLLRAREAVYGYSVSLGAVDEAWKVHPKIVDEGLAPTMVEREQPQLLLISTAHRAATPLMLSRRQAALEQLESGEGDLLVEWSAPAGVELEDVNAWRLASPHWTPKRERMVGDALRQARAGELEPDPEEPDPIESFSAQWLNQWPRRSYELPLNVQDLLPAGLWGNLAEPLLSEGPVWVALEDDAGKGAAVGAAALLGDGRIEVDGWLCDDWDTAIAGALGLGRLRQVRQLLVGASMLDRVLPGTVPAPKPVGSRETRTGLPLLRDLAANGMLVHDVTTTELDAAVGVAQVKETLTGLQLVARGPIHLVKAAVWAVQAAHRPAAVPAIY
jgi:hypothetical protein